MRTLEAIAAAGATDAGLQREVNEDRFHIDEARGLFIVIDGVGGQAAGGKAADVALAMLRGRLERETGPIAERVREAIAVANNEIYRLASTRPEWDGMACVLTIAVVKDGMATIGHVGDTRLYRLRDGFIEKITRDHSPVGEREDACELSEFEAMRHPRRNEVYRDVGSEPHEPGDPDFVDIHEIPFYAGDALLLCSDGLSDLVDSRSVLRTVKEWAGNPSAVAHALVDAAKAAGGKDNVTVVYVEGENFDVSSNVSHLRPAESTAAPHSRAWTTRRRLGTGAGIAVVALLTGLMVYRATTGPLLDAPAGDVTAQEEPSQVVRPDESIAAALMRAQPGAEVVVEPGEYREQVTLSNNVRLVSRVPRGATIRLACHRVRCPTRAGGDRDRLVRVVSSSGSGSLAMRRRRWALAFSFRDPACRWWTSKCPVRRRRPSRSFATVPRRSSEATFTTIRVRRSRSPPAPPLASRTTRSVATAPPRHLRAVARDRRPDVRELVVTEVGEMVDEETEPLASRVRDVGLDGRVRREAKEHRARALEPPDLLDDLLLLVGVGRARTRVDDRVDAL